MALREEPPREQMPTPIMRAVEDVVEKWRGRRSAPQPLKELLRRLYPKNPARGAFSHSYSEEGDTLTHTTSIYSLETGKKIELFRVAVNYEQRAPTVEITPLHKALTPKMLLALSDRLKQAFPLHKVRISTRKQ